ncbi:uncharacterized protein LOC124279595 [Haliotis rubra]|uniref:uncharacterized protein LOC124279595 n=1 Tax=Haliotis rubra TaxID=36100 RepID=UPI001EE5CD90|nr:uncharacterized protein LOC124279595 [Haliotis rubra]
MAALQVQHAELELPSPSEERAEREREYQILMYEAYTDKDDVLKAHKGTDIRMEKDDIQKVLLSLDILQEIDTLEDTQTKKLLENLRKDEMDISEYIVDNMDESEERCYATLIFEKRDKKRKDRSNRNSCKFLTRREVKDIVKEFKAVWDIQRRDSQKLKEHWDRVLRDAKLDPNNFEKLEGYRKLFKEDIEYKQQKRKNASSSRGFENLLKQQDVQRIMFKLYPAIIRINEIIEAFIVAKEKREEKRVIDDLEKKCHRAITAPSAELVKGIVVNNKQKGYLTMLSGTIGDATQSTEVRAYSLTVRENCFTYIPLEHASASSRYLSAYAVHASNNIGASPSYSASSTFATSATSDAYGAYASSSTGAYPVYCVSSCAYANVSRCLHVLGRRP